MWTLENPDRFAAVLQLRAGCSGLGARSLRRTSRQVQPQQYVTVMAHSGTFYSRPIIRSRVSSSVCPITPFPIHHRGRKHLPAQVLNQQHPLINRVPPLLPSVSPGRLVKVVNSGLTELLTFPIVSTLQHSLHLLW